MVLSRRLEKGVHGGRCDWAVVSVVVHTSTDFGARVFHAPTSGASLTKREDNSTDLPIRH